MHRKGATRAFPANHFALKDTPFYETGHPILLPGNPTAGSCVMVADPGADKSCYSVNHGAGRANLGLQAAEEGAVSLRAAAHRLIEILAADRVQRSERYGERVERQAMG